jgi:hypothetical protein
MIDIINAAKEFCLAFSKSQQKIGELVFHETILNINIPSAFAIDGELMELYSHIEMISSPTIGGDLFLQLFQINQLLQAQEGWRWVGG